MTKTQMTSLHSGMLTLLAATLPACSGQMVGWPTVGPCGDSGGDCGDSGVEPVLDETPPLVRWTAPVNAAEDVAPNASIIAVFNETMDPLTLTAANFTLEGGGAVSTGILTEFGSNTISFAPTDDLARDTVYTATISTGMTDLAGNGLVDDYVWSFTTSGELDATAPFVIFTSPEDLATDVAVGATVNATFSEAMDPLTIIGANFTVYGPDPGALAGTVTYDMSNQTGTFTPDDDLLADTTYTATVDTGASDLAGNGMDSNYSWTFTTGAADSLWEPVDLGSLSSFVAVAGAGLTNSNSSGTTTLNGDVGLSPTETCLGDGAPCTATNPVINGTLYANDAEGVAAQAKVDLTAAYIDAMARPVGTMVDDLAGMVLPPGVYTSDSSMSVAVDGTVFLDAEGDENAVWIFQVGSSLTVNNNAQVLLINGAQAGNVFWAVYASSTLGSDVSFQGTVLAGASNSVGTDSVVVGRLLCREGAITLLSNDVTLPPTFE